MKPVLKNLFFIVILSSCLSCFCQQVGQELIFDKYNNQHLGTYICDFSFGTSNDTADYSSVFSVEADSVYVLFYDPFCDHCHKEIKRLKKDSKLNKAIEAGSLVFITIAPDTEFDVWRENLAKMPKQWRNVYTSDKEKIIKKLLWKVPELFVLDKDKRITRIDMYRQYDE